MNHTAGAESAAGRARRGGNVNGGGYREVISPAASGRSRPWVHLLGGPLVVESLVLARGKSA